MHLLTLNIAEGGRGTLSSGIRRAPSVRTSGTGEALYQAAGVWWTDMAGWWSFTAGFWWTGIWALVELLQ